MTDPDEAIEEFLRKANAAYTGMTEFSLRVEQISISGIREVFEASGAGIKAVIQPGGPVNDEDVIEAADDHGMAIAFTGQRAFWNTIRVVVTRPSCRARRRFRQVRPSGRTARPA